MISFPIPDSYHVPRKLWQRDSEDTFAQRIIVERCCANRSLFLWTDPVKLIVPGKEISAGITDAREVQRADEIHDVLPAASVIISCWFPLKYDEDLINYILVNLGLGKSLFYSGTNTAIPSLAMIAVWTSGILIVIFLAGCKTYRVSITRRPKLTALDICAHW